MIITRPGERWPLIWVCHPTPQCLRLPTAWESHPMQALPLPKYCSCLRRWWQQCIHSCWGKGGSSWLQSRASSAWEQSRPRWWSWRWWQVYPGWCWWGSSGSACSDSSRCHSSRWRWVCPCRSWSPCPASSQPPRRTWQWSPATSSDRRSSSTPSQSCPQRSPPPASCPWPPSSCWRVARKTWTRRSSRPDSSASRTAPLLHLTLPSQRGCCQHSQTHNIWNLWISIDVGDTRDEYSRHN